MQCCTKGQLDHKKYLVELQRSRCYCALLHHEHVSADLILLQYYTDQQNYLMYFC